MDDLDKLKDLLKSENTRNQQYGQSVEPGYFDELEKKIILGSTQNQTTAKEKSSRKALYMKLVKYSSIAAAIALLFVGFNFFNTNQVDTYAQNSNAEMNVDYLLETEDIYIEDFTEMEGIDEILDELEQQLKN